MLSAVKNFFLAFVISLLIFSLIAYMVVGLVIKNINGSIGGGTDSGTVVTTKEPDVTNAEGDVIGPIDYGDGGESFNVLLIGTDYRPSTLVNYDPARLEALYGLVAQPFTPAATPADLATPRHTTGIISDKNNSSAGVPTTDGKLAFPGGFYSVSYRTIEADTIILVRVDKERGQYSYTSFPEDAYINISGKYVKISEVYGLYGLDFLIDKIHAITGVVIDNYAVLSMEEFPAVIDALGGVNYYVPCNMNYDDYAGDVHIHLTAGRQLLNGDTALQLLSYNTYEEGAGSRKSTTLSFLKALVSSLTSVTNYRSASMIFARVDGLIKTDFTAADFLKNVDMIFKYSGNQADIAVITKDAVDGSGESIVIIDEKATITAFSQYRRVFNNK